MALFIRVKSVSGGQAGREHYDHLLGHSHEKTLYANTKYAVIHTVDGARVHCSLQKKKKTEKKLPMGDRDMGKQKVRM